MMKKNQAVNIWHEIERAAWEPKTEAELIREQPAECARLGYCVGTHNGEWISRLDLGLSRACVELGRCIIDGDPEPPRCICGCGRILAEMPRTEGGDDGTEAAKK